MRMPISMTLLFALTAGAQQIGQNASPEANSTYTMTVKSQLVVEAVGVKDKQGNPVKGLTAKDFAITEDGTAQTIKFCEYQELPAAGSQPPLVAGPEDVKIYKQLAKTQISAEAAGSVNYNYLRLLAL